ncbi:MAG: hypothetical protein ACE5G2_06150 [Candidatus Krumholzibacteriia bacterium]
MRRALERAAAVLALVTATWIVAARTSGAGSLPPASARGGTPDATWRHDPIWDDGNAEFCAYEVTWHRYGNLYEGRALLVLVKEPWAPDLNVKADRPRPDGFEVLKLNHVRDVATGIYTYHQMASVYFRRDSGSLVKIAATSSEACGISMAEMVDGRLETRSYFDGQGDRTTPYPADSVPEDGLPALLRDYVQGEPPRMLQVVPSLLRGRFAHLDAAAYTVHKRRVARIDVPAGTFSGVEIELRSGDRSIAYVFEDTGPFRVLRIRHSDGTEYRLAKVERIPYWRMNQPGGEAWLPEHVR